MSHTYHKDRDGFYRVRDGKGHLVCRDIELEETARLHAAAPELLKAAQGYLEIAQAILDGDDVEEETWEAIVADLKPIIARATLSEIEGKEGG